jgi:hypothetical protein
MSLISIGWISEYGCAFLSAALSLTSPNFSRAEPAAPWFSFSMGPYRIGIGKYGIGWRLHKRPGLGHIYKRFRAALGEMVAALNKIVHETLDALQLATLIFSDSNVTVLGSTMR